MECLAATFNSDTTDTVVGVGRDGDQPLRCLRNSVGLMPVWWRKKWLK